MSRFSRWTAILALAPLMILSVVFVASPATATAVGYVRLAHLSPDTPPVDVYLSAVAAGSPARRFPAVGYGVMSEYMPVPPGTYSVAMRNTNAPESTAPVLSTQVTVSAGGAYTVAGVGRFADLGLRVIDDDLKLPSPGLAKVRVIQASVRAPLLDVSVATGDRIATGVPFATTTSYREVKPGKWRLKLQPTGSTMATEVAADCDAGSVYSVLVLDGKDGKLTIQVRTDARAGSTVPLGGVETGAGGSQAPPRPATALLITVVALLLGGGLSAGLLRRRQTRPAPRPAPRT